MQERKVSVIIPTYKRPDVIGRAIESVLNQTYQNIEIIIVDDNDSNTKERRLTEVTVEKYTSNMNVKYIKHLKNKNGSAARNTGFRHSSGDYITFLDDDDEFLPNRIEKCVQVTNTLDITFAGCTTGIYKYLKGYKIKSKKKRSDNMLVEMLARNAYTAEGSNIFIRRNVFEVLNGFDESYKRNQDIEFIARLYQKYDLKYVNDKLLIMHYEIRDFNLSYDKTIEIEKYFLDKFQKTIKSLSPDKQKYIYRNISIQRFRPALKHKQLSNFFKNNKRHKVSLFAVVFYILYLLKRRIFKSYYGFNYYKYK